MSLSPRPPPESCGIILDGRLPGLLACWAETVCRSPSPANPIAWLSPLPTTAPRACRAAAGRQAELCGMGELVALSGHAAGAMPGMDDVGGSPDRAETAMLLAACYAAMDAGVPRVIWPDQVGAVGVDDVDLDAIADVCDRAMLIAQLANLESPRTGVSVRIETPYADLTDSQLMELAIDTGAPLGAAWWCDHEGEQLCGRCEQCTRWQTALTAVHAGATLAGLIAKNSGLRTVASSA